MKTSRIKNIRIHLSDKKAPVPIQETINQLYINWIDKQLMQSNYDKNMKIKVINGIVKTIQLKK